MAERLLPPQASIGVSLATLAVVYSIYSKAMPPITDIRVADQQNEHLAASEKGARWAAAGTVGLVSLIARDPDIFIIGGLGVIGLSWWHRHANLVNPDTGKAVQEMRAPELVPETQMAGSVYGYAGDSFGS